MNSLGMATRSALVRHAERGLGIRHRPHGARDVVCAINPIPQPTPHGLSEKEGDREFHGFLAAAAVMTFISAVLILSQYLPGAAQ